MKSSILFVSTKTLHQNWCSPPEIGKLTCMKELVAIDPSGKYRLHVELVCSNCGDTFLKQKRFLKKSVSGLHYCNRKCYIEHSKSRNAGKHVTVKCAFCGKETEKAVSKLSNSKHGIYFCNRDCKDKGQRVENGITEIHPPHYHDGANYYSKLARNTHGNRCADCGNSFEPFLSVHHVDGNRENFSLDNLEVLCYNHHILRHLRLTEQGWVLDWKVLTPRESLITLIEESCKI